MPFLKINPVLTESPRDTLENGSNGTPANGTPQSNGSLEDSSLPLNQLLAKIVSQNGPFVDITEESLLSEIAGNNKEREGKQMKQEPTDEDAEMEEAFPSPGMASSDLPSPSLAPSASPASSLTVEEFMKQKEKAIGYMDSALNESSLSLDFVSLLISCLRPAAGTSSMSPHLKQHVKVGSLSSGRITRQNQQKDEDIARDKKNQSAGRGWKLQSLSRVSNDLKAAAERLSGEISKEKQYWDGMMDIVRSDEVVIPVKSSRNGKSAKDIGVKYGFGDAGSNYYDKGIGLLLKDRDGGELYFERKDVIPQVQSMQSNGKGEAHKVVTVKIYKRRGGKQDESDLELVGESDIVGRIPGDQGCKVLDDIRRARFFLFEEELFYQLMKEAATLISLQVKVDSGKIFVEFYHIVLEIGFASAEEIAKEKGELVSRNEEFDRQADEVGCFLRLMLCFQHRQNLQKRRLPPISLCQLQSRNQTNAQSVLMLLRPLITYKKHNRTILKLKTALKSILLNLEAKDEDKVNKIMTDNFRIKKFCNDPNQMKRYRSKHRLSRGNPFIRCLMSPLSVMELKYKGRLRIILELTSDSKASFSTIVVRVDKSERGDGDYGKEILDVEFSHVREVEDCVGWVMRTAEKTNQPDAERSEVASAVANGLPSENGLSNEAGEVPNDTK
ncbi:DEKNAAC101807 [Brettanomyces naardenensis]|uniref:Mediator of RNA polymerase II transcription subunit 17 n=1 Tax=Brettanomyces naardenensis TaxID=13370 RepID=A0A448YJ37_BRENA|nr:DEKNAAC101807 [Brettanomyces naardenensis]